MDYKRADTIFGQDLLWSVTSSFLEIWEVARMAHAFRWPRLLKGFRARSTAIKISALFDPSFQRSGVLPFLIHIDLAIEREVQMVRKWLDACREQTIPSTVSEVVFLKSCFNPPIQKALYSLPSSIIRLRLPNFFESVNLSRLPSSLRTLELGAGWTKPVDSLSEGLTSLKFAYSSPFNHPLFLPTSLTELYMCADERFDRPLSNLPPCLKTLVIWSQRFNQKLDCLPKSLTSLQISSKAFNRPLTGLPDSLTHLSVQSDTHSIPDLPPSLTELYLDLPLYPHKSLSHLPKSLRALSFHVSSLALQRSHILSSLYPFLQNLPSSLREVRVSIPCFPSIPSVVSIPPLLTSLSLEYHLAGNISLPSSLSELRLCDRRQGDRACYSIALPVLPSSLISLELPACYDKPLESLPANLTRLVFPPASEYNLPLPVLPSKLRILILGSAFNQPLASLPKSLRLLDLWFSSEFNHPLDDLPDSLQTLRLGLDYQQPLRHLPPSLQTLELRSLKRVDVILPDSIIFLNWNRNVALPPQLPSFLQHLRFALDSSRSVPDLKDLLALPYMKEISTAGDSYSLEMNSVVKEMCLRVRNYSRPQEMPTFDEDFQFPGHRDRVDVKADDDDDSDAFAYDSDYEDFDGYDSDYSGSFDYDAGGYMEDFFWP